MGPHRLLIDLAEEDGTEIERPHAVVALFERHVMVLESVAQEGSRSLKRMVPAFVTRFTRKGPGYSSAGSVRGYARGMACSARRWLTPERGVRPLVIVLATERRKGDSASIS